MARLQINTKKRIDFKREHTEVLLPDCFFNFFFHFLLTFSGFFFFCFNFTWCRNCVAFADQSYSSKLLLFIRSVNLDLSSIPNRETPTLWTL